MKDFYFNKLTNKNSNFYQANLEQPLIKFNFNLSDEFIIINLKHELSKALKIRIDCIQLLSFDENNIISDKTTLNYSKNNKFHLITKQNNNNTKVIIDYFIDNIDKLVFEVNESCSYYCLKYLTAKKLNLDIEELVFMNKSNGSYLNDEDLIGEIEKDLTNCNSKNSRSNNFSVTTNCDSSNKIENILLIRKNKTNLKIGLNLSFTMMKNLKKIKFDEEAPNYREVSDGLSLFCYCNNKNCEIFNEMFVESLGKIKFKNKKLGFGKIDLDNKTKNNICCVKCLNYKNIEIRSFGFVNCEWIYKGILANKKDAFINGDGSTIDSKLYVMKEIDIFKQVERIEITVKYCSPKINTVETLISELSDYENEEKLKSKVKNNINKKNRLNINDTTNKDIIDKLETTNAFNNINNNYSDNKTNLNKETLDIIVEKDTNKICFGLGDKDNGLCLIF